MKDLRKTLDKYATVLRYLLTTVGCYPSESGDFNLFYLFFILSLSIYGLVTAFQCVYMAWPNDINQLAYNVTPFLGQLLVGTKLINYIIRRKDNYKLINIINKRFWNFANEKSQEEQNILLQYERFVYLFNFVQIGTMFSAASMWLLKPILQMFILSGSSNATFKRILPFNHWIPFGLDIFSDPLYEIFYIIQILSYSLSVTVLTAMDCLFVHFILNTCAQFKILQLRLRDFDKNEIGIKCDRKTQERNLCNCIEHHQQLLEFCDDLEDTLTITLLIQFFVGVTFTCGSAIVMTMFPGNTFIYLQNLLCMSASLAQLFLHCFTANVLTTEGLDVAWAAYESNWYNAPCAIQKIILFIIMRAQKPIYLTVGKFAPVSVALFETFVRTAVSYFTVFTSMREE